MDLCVNYEIVQDLNIGSVYFYGKFTCNQIGDKVSFTVFNNDNTCNGQGEIVGNYTMENKIPGDLASFNCIGQDNYVQVLQYTNNDACCDDFPISIIYATNVCFNYGDGTFSMYVILDTYNYK